MKKVLLFLFCFLFLLGCSGISQYKNLSTYYDDQLKIRKYILSKEGKDLKFVVPETPEEGKPYSLEDLQQLAQGTGAAKVRAFDHETGNDTGAMDKITITSGNLTDGDFSFVITNDAAGRNLKAFVFDADGEDPAVTGFVVRPNDYDGDTKIGVWKLIGSFSIYPSSTPEIDFRDLEASGLVGGSGDGDINGKIYLNCTTVTTNAEECLIYFQVQDGDGGATKTYMTIDGANQQVLFAKVIQPTGGINDLTPVQDDADNFAANFTGANLKGGTFIATSATGSSDLSAIAAGVNFVYEVEDGVSANVNPNGSDTIYLNNVVHSSGAGASVDITGPGLCVIKYRDTNEIDMQCDGSAIEGS